jgi:hypothetical protein
MVESGKAIAMKREDLESWVKPRWDDIFTD